MHGRLPLSLGEGIRAKRTVDEATDLRRVVNFIRRRWEIITASVLAITIVTVAATFVIPARYTATAEVLLEPKKENIFGGDNIIPALNLDSANVDSQVSVIRSITLLRRVVQANGLVGDDEFGESRKRDLFDVALRSLFSREPVEASSRSDDAQGILRAIDHLADALTVNRVGRTYVISISVTSKDPAKAVRLANAIADAYVVDRLEARYDAAKRASAWLTDRIASLRGQVRQSEEAVAKFRQDNNLTVSREGTVAVSEQQLSELNSNLIAARAETAEKRAKYQQTRQLQDRGADLQAIPDVVRSTVISDLRKQQAEITRKEADLVARYSEAHPAVVNARAERRDVERNIGAEVARIIGNLKNEFDVAKAREDSLQASLNVLTGAGGGDGTLGVKLRELERASDANRTLFENFLSRAKITQEQVSFEEREARVISPATMPDRPSFPRKLQFLIAALALGLVLGLAGAYAADTLASGFNTPHDVEVELGRPVLATVSLLGTRERKIDRKVVDPATYFIKKPLSQFAEQVRAVRVGVQMDDVQDPAKVLLITSSLPKEGKSTLAMCLAFSAVKTGQRTVLLDCDLRHPMTSRYFGGDGRLGLTDYLVGAVPLDSILVTSGSLVLIPAGSRSQNSTDLLASARMKQLIEQLRATFDYVVIDSPPVSPVVDAKVLLQYVDKVIFAIRWQSTPKGAALECLQHLTSEHKIAGVVLNCLNERTASRYGQYQSSKRYRDYYQQ
jgi:succinoglycan biosynthesis transport protein ExoP